VDILSIIGLVLGLGAILFGAVLKGAGLMALVSAAAFTIVVIGTIAAICVQTPLVVMKRALRIFPWIMRPPPLQGPELIKKMVEWSNIARKQGLLSLEVVLNREPDSFVRKALQLVVDGGEPEVIRDVMEVEMNAREHADTRAAKVFEGMGIYCPTLGIIGAVLGLMAVMQNLADPSKLGHGIAAAFTATVYGIGFANLFFLPVAAKLKGAIQSQTQVREMVIEGMLAIAQGENPRSIESRLEGYLH
jgi:chemotaxis protein MotA